MTARSNIAINHPSTSIPLPPATLENSGTSQVNGPLPTIQACSIRSVTVLQIVESRESKFSNPLSAQGTATTTNKRDYSTESAVSRPPSPTAPIQGEAPNDMLMRMFNARSEQLTDSYRPNVQVNSEATAENNLKLLQELYPPNKCGAGGGLTKVRAAGVVVERVCHFGKKMLYKHVARSLRDANGRIRSGKKKDCRKRQTVLNHIFPQEATPRTQKTRRREAREAAQKRRQKGRIKESRTSIHNSHTSHRRASHR